MTKQGDRPPAVTPDQLRPASRTAAPAPVLEANRVDAVDTLRGVAVLGILVMNITTFAMPMAGYFNPTAVFRYEGVNRATYWFTHIVFDMKMMSIFSMLFGAGVVLFAKKIDRGASLSRVRLSWFLRLFWLLMIGLVHAVFVWVGDILVTYAVTGALLAWWMRRVPPMGLAVLSGVFLLVGAVGAVLLGVYFFINEFAHTSWVMSLPHEMREGMAEGYAEVRGGFVPTAEDIRAQSDLFRGGYLPILKSRIVEVVFGYFSYVPLMLFWRAGAMMAMGILLFKTRVLDASRSRKFYLVMAVVGYAVGVPIVVVGLRFNEDHGFNPGLLMTVGMLFNYFGSVAIALAHIGVVMLACKAGALGWLTGSLAAAGRLALTNYLTQSLVCSFLFYGYGFGLYLRFDRAEQVGIAAAIGVVQVVFSVLWLRGFRLGPAEWVWRSLTYLRPAPLVRSRADAGFSGVGDDRPGR